ncbi:hypothetical protein B0T26DRAFT_336248 [Lasiosphaeria miniovina]|uniref:Secreted protein n=1 Tax=Lasiosphaeria miniovina TaxID=1954250 RepID=A0AA40AAM0_9PEZI|nr:uncharacterized protein B0T26DRAFT_336248 [Lasiosphaeria miniovina]KAK0712380.1 hypothetical protein B0T26DRAFT_336248 [Lasiosphaeria miniovina]
MYVYVSLLLVTYFLWAPRSDGTKRDGSKKNYGMRPTRNRRIAGSTAHSIFHNFGLGFLVKLYRAWGWGMARLWLFVGKKEEKGSLPSALPILYTMPCCVQRVSTSETPLMGMYGLRHQGGRSLAEAGSEGLGAVGLPRAQCYQVALNMTRRVLYKAFNVQRFARQ